MYVPIIFTTRYSTICSSLYYFRIILKTIIMYSIVYTCKNALILTCSTDILLISKNSVIGFFPNINTARYASTNIIRVATITSTYH